MVLWVKSKVNSSADFSWQVINEIDGSLQCHFVYITGKSLGLVAKKLTLVATVESHDLSSSFQTQVSSQIQSHLIEVEACSP